MAEGRAAKKTSSSSKGKPGVRENRATQFLILLLLFGCCAASAFLYIGTKRLVEQNYTPIHNANITIDTTLEESREVETTQSAVSSLGRASSQVAQSAMLAEISGRRPFGTPTSLVAGQASSALIDAGLPLVEEQPPVVTVVAVMIKDSDKVAMIDVQGEEGGLVVRIGSKFSDGNARITQINPEGVKFTWMKKSYEATMPR